MATKYTLGWISTSPQKMEMYKLLLYMWMIEKKMKQNIRLLRIIFCAARAVGKILHDFDFSLLPNLFGCSIKNFSIPVSYFFFRWFSECMLTQWIKIPVYSVLFHLEMFETKCWRKSSKKKIRYQKRSKKEEKKLQNQTPLE